MKGQGGMELIWIPVIILIAIIFLPVLSKFSSDISEAPKLREQLQTCQNSLNSVQNENNDLKKQVKELGSKLENASLIIKDCENEIENVRNQLGQCNDSLQKCFENTTSLSDRITSLSKCCLDSEECRKELNRCLEANRTITTVNIWDYSVNFVDLKINIIYTLILFASLPIIDIISIPLIDFSIVTLEVKFKRKKTEKIVFFIKYLPKILALSALASFFLKLPLIPTLGISFILGLLVCNGIFETTYRRKWFLFESFKMEIDKILEELTKKKNEEKENK